jgi:cytosine/adenosine deaminase-related metal-dependent hydrolase
LACTVTIFGCNGIDKNNNESNDNEVDIIIKNANIVTMNPDRDVIDEGFVAINDRKISAVADSSEVGQYTAEKTIDVNGDIVMPGLINAHTHVSMSVFRSLADDVPDRLHRYIFPLEQKLVSREMVRIGAQLGNIEMIKGGVTTYADMYYFEDEVAKTVDEIGMRGVLGETVINFPVADADSPEEGIQYALEFIEEYKDHPRITPAFAPHAPYTNTTETLRKVTDLSQEHDVPVLIHLAESDQETKDIAERTGGLSPVEYMSEIGALTPNLVAAHLIKVDERDLELLEKNDVGIAHNMSANTKSAKGVAPVLQMLDKNLRVGLGTDGPMSGNTLSTIDEFSQVAKVHKLVNEDRSVMPPIKVIEMATIGAARALHMEDKIGSLEKGKLADITVVDTEASNMIPIYNPYSALVYSAYPTNVEHTIVDGKIIMRDNEMLTVNADSIRASAIQFEDKVRGAVRESGEVVQ